MEALYGTGVTASELKGLERDAIVQEFLDDALDAYADREQELEGLQEGLMRDLERFIVLQTVDVRWREHLENMDYLREGIGLRGLAQKDPLVEYRNEGHVMFAELTRSIREEVVALLYHAEVTAADGTLPAEQEPAAETLSYEHESLAGSQAMLAAGSATPRRAPASPRAAASRPPWRRSRKSTASTRTSAGTTCARAGPARSSSAATAPDAGFATRSSRHRPVVAE